MTKTNEKTVEAAAGVVLLVVRPFGRDDPAEVGLAPGRATFSTRW
jgi:hypothetical protein